jgi:hypothetical protein
MDLFEFNLRRLAGTTSRALVLVADRTIFTEYSTCSTAIVNRIMYRVQYLFPSSNQYLYRLNSDVPMKGNQTGSNFRYLACIGYRTQSFELDKFKNNNTHTNISSMPLQCPSLNSFDLTLTSPKHVFDPVSSDPAHPQI